MSVWLGVDMGGTATRWVARTARGEIIARGEVAGATALPDSASRAQFHAVLSQISVTAPSDKSAITMGLTGAGLVPTPDTIEICAQAFGIAENRLTILNDMVLAWHTAYPEGGGYLVAAGTGSVGLSIDRAGEILLVGGRGTLIDDAGSGAWIGLQALNALWRLIDLHGAPKGAEKLAQHVFDIIGGSDWEDTRHWVYAGDRGKIAKLAPAVAAAAVDGDPVALDLMRNAGTELARLASALIARRGAALVGLTGGVFNLHPDVLAAMHEALPDVSLTRITLDAAAHAATMAQQFHPSEAP